ncbi:colicin [Erwinia sp. E602]|uniref:colicin-like pore-forming protein n=1 Tax=Erwinia sp. E602 TaxID=2675378 RepID=UPI001BAE0A3E|nr:colicin-like pore-forming protein [Erwinia sp. E602]QUG75090.1 colicin [Erwinia sp. E602]
MATPAYYKDGVPYTAEGSPIITITGGPLGSNSNEGIGSSHPIYVGVPGLPPMSHGIGPIKNYDPNKLGHYSLAKIRDAQSKVNELIVKAKKDYPENAEATLENARVMLASLRKSDIIEQPDVKNKSYELEEAINALEKNITLKIETEKEIKIKEIASDKAFDEFINRKDVQLANFKKKRPSEFDFAFSVNPVYRHVVKFWDSIYLSKIREEMVAKNNLVTYLDRVKVIRDDLIKKESVLGEMKTSLKKPTEENTVTSSDDNAPYEKAIKLTASFYKELAEKLGDRAARAAEELAISVNGKKIRNVDEALNAFDKYKDVINKKFSTKDREAITKALESIDRVELAKKFSIFSTAFKYIGNTVDVYDVAMELKKSIETGVWRPFFVKLESLAAGRAATALTAFAFSLIAGAPLGILGFALIMTLIGALVDDKLVEKMNNLIGL